MPTVGEIKVILGLESAAFKAGLADAKAGMVGWRDETNKSTGEMAKWGAAIALTAAPLIALGYELQALTTQAAQFGKTIKDNARDLGLSTDQYQRWTHAAIAAGSSAEEITSTIRMMSIRFKEAADPASEIARYLKAMGVSATDSTGQMRPMNDVLMDIIPALNRLPEGMERNQASMVLFGRSWSNIADLTSLSRSELQKLMDQAPVFSDEKIQKMDEMAIQSALLNEQIQIMSVDLGEDLIPLAQDMIGVFTELGPVIKGVANTLHEAATGSVMMAQGLQLMYTQWKYGMDSPEMKALQASVQAYFTSEQNERTGVSNKTTKSLYDLQMERAMRLQVEPKPEAAKAESTASPKGLSSSSWENTAVVGTPGSDFNKFMIEEMEAGSDYKTALESSKDGVHSYNKPGSLGATKQAGAKGADKKAASPAEKAASDTKTITSELTTQGDAYKTLNDAILASWIDIESKGVTHNTAMSGMSRIMMQKLMDDWYTSAEYITKTVAYANTISVTDGKLGGTPKEFEGAPPPVLETIDFKAVTFSGGGGGTGAGTGNAEGGTKTVNITVNQTNNGVKTDAQGMNKALGAIANTGGLI